MNYGGETVKFTKDNFKQLAINKIDVLASEEESLAEWCRKHHYRYETIRNAKYKGYISDLNARKIWCQYVCKYDVPRCIHEAVDPILEEIEKEYGISNE